MTIITFHPHRIFPVCPNTADPVRNRTLFWMRRDPPAVRNCCSASGRNFTGTSGLWHITECLLSNWLKSRNPFSVEYLWTFGAGCAGGRFPGWTRSSDEQQQQQRDAAAFSPAAPLIRSNSITLHPQLMNQTTPVLLPLSFINPKCCKRQPIG